ncbi:MAG: hypothetical protein ACLSVD_17250 [Eggerthellaceae bacterium]
MGLTRASEALVVAMDAKAPARQLRRTLRSWTTSARAGGTGDFPEGTAALEYGGSEPARFERILVQAGGRALRRRRPGGRAPSFAGRGRARRKRGFPAP